MILVYHQHSSERLTYILQVLFQQQHKATNSTEEFLQYRGVKINYSSVPVDTNEIQIIPHKILFEKNISPQIVECFEWQGFKAFFKTNGSIPFDLFAASFYLISRYEEYLPYEKDMYGRYAHTNSVAFQNNFLHLPMVNLWLLELEKICQQKIVDFKLLNSRFCFIPTYDIDIAFRYRYHAVFRNIGGFFKDFITANFESITERALVYSGKSKDPFDVYDWLQEIHSTYQLNPVYFFLMAKKLKGYDRNIATNSLGFKKLIQQITTKNSVGIHPSWQSGDDEKLLGEEIQTLQQVCNNKIKDSRQHYIRMDLPNTYRLLIQNKIANDYSMGYGSINGFRASYTLPFKWFDLEKKESTSLMLYPFCYMDANAFFEEKLSAEEAAISLQAYHDIVKKVNGTFITIYHNHFLTKQPQWLRWRNVYLDFLKNNFLIR